MGEKQAERFPVIQLLGSLEVMNILDFIQWVNEFPVIQLLGSLEVSGSLLCSMRAKRVSSNSASRKLGSLLTKRTDTYRSGFQ